MRIFFRVYPYHYQKIQLLALKHDEDLQKVNFTRPPRTQKKKYSDKSPFELFQPQKLCVMFHDVPWCSIMFEISTLRKGVWSMIFSGLTDLHIVLHKSNIDQEYYCTNILETNVFKILKKKMHSEVQLIFQQDGVRPHTALRMRRLLQENKFHYWTNGLR